MNRKGKKLSIIEKKSPIGIDDFKTLIEKVCYLVNKSLLIKEFINNSGIDKLERRSLRR